MSDHSALLNGFLVDVFNDILRLEEAVIRKGPCKNLSVSEMHVLEAVDRASAGSPDGAHMADLAGQLAITSGTLSVAVKTLEQKGYLARRRSENDRRRVTVVLTDAALPALAIHADFHERLVSHALEQLSEEECAALASALTSLHSFFSEL